MFQIIKKIAPHKKESLYINFEDERLYPLSGDELTLLLDVYIEMYGNLPKYLYLDEIQNIPYWEKWTRRIQEKNQKIKILITGSNSQLLSKEIATQLGGRTLTLSMLPFSFKEFCAYKKIDYSITNIDYSQNRHKIAHYFNEYMNCGGFPEVFEETERIKILQEYFNSVFYKDLLSRYSIENKKSFEDFLRLCLQNYSTLISISKIAKITRGLTG